MGSGGTPEPFKRLLIRIIETLLFLVAFDLCIFTITGMKPGNRLGFGPVYELSEADIPRLYSIGFNEVVDLLLIQIFYILRSMRANNSSLNRLDFIYT